MAGGNVPANLAPIFQAAGAQYHIPPAVLAGIASVETNLGANRATSSAGAVGLMQFEPGTAKGLGINPLDDKQAIFGAARLLNEYGYQHDPFRAIGAYNGGPGNPQSGYASQVLSEAQRLAGEVHGHAAGASAGGGAAVTGGYGLPSVSTTFSGGGTDWNSAGIAALMKDASAPIGTGRFKADNLLGDLLSNAESGNYTTPSTANSHLSSAPGFHAPGTGPVGSHSGDVNPLPGFTIGRTDMGVDANAKPGTPILAPNDSRVVGIQHNWYAGQPYVWLQITNGPNAGKYWYVAEQITNLPKVGQTIGKGQQVATYAPSGTGIEIGWGSPTWQTAAQAEGKTGDASHGDAPAGVSFRNYLGALGASVASP